MRAVVVGSVVSVVVLGLAACGAGPTQDPAPENAGDETAGNPQQPPPDVGPALTADLFPRPIIPQHGAQLALTYADTPPPGTSGPLVPIYGIKIPFADQTPPWTVVNATAPPAGWTEMITGEAYCVSTTTDPLLPGAGLQCFFSYNTTTLQPATQFQTGPVKLMDQAGADVGTADMLYR